MDKEQELKQLEDYKPHIQAQILKAGNIEAWKENLRRIAATAKTTTHGFNNPEVRAKAQATRRKNRKESS